MEELFFANLMHFQPANAFTTSLLLEAPAPGLVENVFANGRGVELDHL